MHHSLKFVNPRQHSQVFVVAQVHVVTLGVPRVEGMVADHVEALRGGTQITGRY